MQRIWPDTAALVWAASLAAALVYPTAVIAADPVFLNRSGSLPVSHVYDGGWEHFVGGGVAVFDCNGDSLPEIFAAGGENPVRLFLNTTETAGAPLSFLLGEVPDLIGVTGAYPLDVDSDGLLDLVVLRAGPNVMLKGQGECQFTDATKEWGIVPEDRWTTAFSATWEPGETWPTLAFGNYVDRADPDGPFGACDDSELFRPEGEGYSNPQVLEPGYCPLSMMFSDWFRRGRADLWLSNDRHYYIRGGHEQMYRLDEGRFLGAEDGWEEVSIWGMGIAARDLTGDGRPEVMLTSMGDQLLQFATAQGFRRAPYETGATAHRPFTGDDGRPSTGWHAAFDDVNNDGLADIFISKGNVDQMPGLAMHDPNNLLMGRPDGTFVEAAAIAGIATMSRSRGAALADLNGDGLRDLVVINRRAPMEVWQNATAGGGNWVDVELRQNGSNTRAIGAWVELRDTSGIRLQELTVGGGHASGTAVPLHFGLGQAGSAEVRVTWPDGKVSEWSVVPINDLTTITRDR
ncbi:CRTAC1 family protein [Pseudoruegeria sp. HB172150]|uniref:CRTAC1 family protein n=1 Tax=Pseudoruegeria sp. HB172150 TaxID=2721164 RepID=UPI0015575C59|nr:CRTAC1 family protein [Pseudoruegeria sp. HB172150]